jgi:cation transporter-like permease
LRKRRKRSGDVNRLSGTALIGFVLGIVVALVGQEHTRAYLMAGGDATVQGLLNVTVSGVLLSLAFVALALVGRLFRRVGWLFRRRDSN